MVWRALLGLIIIGFVSEISAQDKARLTGNFIANGNFFLRDSTIGASNTPQYEGELFGGEAWLNLNYVKKDLDIGLRLDGFYHSNLRNPNDSYTARGIGFWYVEKDIKGLSLRLGHIYDQLGNGIIYRSFEDRTLLIDNALIGAKGEYSFSDDWSIKGFIGKQRNLFSYRPALIKGVALNGYMSNKSASIHFAPGIAFINRTLSQDDVDQLVSVVRQYLDEDRIELRYNAYAMSYFHTLGVGPLSWSAEIAYKPRDVFFDPDAPKTELTGAISKGKLVREAGSVLYTSLTFIKNKLSILLEAKRVENFDFRTNPILSGNQGVINFIPTVNQQNSYTLLAQYLPQTQFLSENSFHANAGYRFNKRMNASIDYSRISTLEGKRLFQETLAEFVLKKPRVWTLTTTFQFLEYDSEFYEGNIGAEVIQSLAGVVDFLYKFDRKKSLRSEIQYQHTQQDRGSWVFGLMELGLAPHWLFELSASYNTTPTVDSNPGRFYPAVGVVYSHHGNRYGVRYTKQQDGIVCSGGICRYEPAFSGVRFNVNTNF